MNTVIIGANSYIARNMIAKNLNRNYTDVSLFDRDTEHFDGAKNYAQIDIFNLNSVKKAISNCDILFFFTGKTGTLQGFDQPDLFLNVNEKALFVLLNACREVNPSIKIIFPSTRLVYKGSELLLSEDAEKEFLTPYAIQKYSCEKYLEMYHKLFNINYCVARICVPYGTAVKSMGSYGTLDSFIKQAKETGKINIFGDGLQRRTFTYIEDLCESLWELGLSDKCINAVYNIGGEDISINDVAESIASLYGVIVNHVAWPDNYRLIESGSTVFDSSKLDNIIGKKVSVSFRDWITENIKD